ncbi:hypothetical protein PENSPDRAFT_732308 [Peniophora sp. CONT]|nr:hypothetical protein PENSPDRAFT_732308 [Peniophora sp. CONT]
MTVAHLHPPSPSNSSTMTLESPISRLPVEVLSRVFCHLSSSAKPDEKDLHAPAPPWCHVLHVCRWWRKVAVETKELWRIIPFGNAEWTNMALRLSRPRSIAVCLCSTRATDETSSHIYDVAASALSPEYHRAHRIHLLLHLRDDEDDSQDHRIVDDLKEVTPDELVDLYLHGDRTVLPLDHIVFRKEPANLRHLRLQLCLLHESPNIFVNTLTTLRMETCILTGTYTISMFASDIKFLLSLEDLSLICVTPLNLDGMPPFPEIGRSSRTLLPNLKRCKLVSQYSVLYVYLANIDTPLNCHWDILGSPYAGHDVGLSTLEPVRPLAQLLASRITSVVSMPRVRLDIHLSKTVGGKGNLRFTTKGVSFPYTFGTWCMLDWGIDPELDGRFEVPSLPDLVTAVPKDVLINAVCIDMELDDVEWEAIRPLLSRTRTLQFESPRFAVNCPFTRRRLKDEELSHLKMIQVECDEPMTAAQNKDSFQLIENIIRYCLPRDGLRVKIYLDMDWPTEEELVILESYGESVELQPAFRWSAEGRRVRLPPKDRPKEAPSLPFLEENGLNGSQSIINL